ncbi:MAG: paraquat-inducible protein A [Ekhidna sp.]
MKSKVLSIFFTLAILTASVFLVRSEQSRRVLKADFIEVSKAKYGIFNIDVWKEKIAEIVANKIDEFQFDPKNKKELIEKIESFLYQGVDYLEITIKSQQYSSVRGFFKNAFASGLNVFDDIRGNVPALAKSIVNDLEKPETRAKIKAFIKLKIDQYADETFAQVDYTERNRILLKYEQNSVTEAAEQLSVQLQTSSESAWAYKVGIYISVLSLMLIILVSKGERLKAELMTALIACVALLSLGLFLPMIDIDARITEFDLVVLDEHIGFQNQILYFKSKSILEVVGLMLSQGQIDVVAVGFLVLSFSVLFPMAKIIACFSFLINKRENHSRVIRFFVFKSGKWSMADVLVVAIFMAYIGFSSILSEQLNQLEKISDSLQILTTNRSELNTGFFMFFAFVCLSLIVSDRINRDLK